MGKKTSKGIIESGLKWEIAEELGLAEKIRRVGWSGLSAAETGRIGGLMRQGSIKDRRDKRMPVENSNKKDKVTPDKGSVEAKIGSAYQATIAGQPLLKGFVQKTDKRSRVRSGTENNSENKE